MTEPVVAWPELERRRVAIAEAYEEFQHQEGARERANDFAGFLLAHLNRAGYELRRLPQGLGPATPTQGGQAWPM